MKKILSFSLFLGFLLGSTALTAVAEGGDQWKVQGKAVSGTETLSWNMKSSKFFEYRDIPEGFFLNMLGVSLKKGDWYFNFAADRVGRRDGTYAFTLGSQGKYKLSVGYDRTPHVFSFEGRTLYYEAAPGEYRIADAIQKAAEDAVGDGVVNSGNIDKAIALISSYLTGARPVDLSLQRNKSTIDFSYNLSAPLSFNLNASRETRNGTRPLGASFAFNFANEVPEPIDYTTTNLDARLRFSGKWGTVQASAAFYTFENDIQTLIWDNPLRLTDQTYDSATIGGVRYSAAYSIGNGTSSGQMSLSPSNTASRFTFNGVVKLMKSFRLSASASYGILTQNENLLPITVNTAIGHEDPSVLTAPRTSANAKANISSVNFTLSGRLFKNVHLRAGYRYYDFGNKMPELSLDHYVRLDQNIEADVTAKPYSFTRDKLFAGVSFNFLRNTSFSLEYALSGMKRMHGHEDGGRTDERTFKASLDTHLLDWLDLRATYLMAKREWSLDGEEDIYIPGFNFKRYHEASRDRTGVNFSAGLALIKNFDLSFSYMLGRDDYTESDHGLKKFDFDIYSIDAAYMVDKGISVYGFYAWESYQGDQASRQSGSTFSTDERDDWTLTLEDIIQSVGAGFNTFIIKDKLGLDISYSTSKAKGTADFYSPPGMKDGPDLASNFNNNNLDSTTIQAIKTKLIWRLSPSFAIVGGYWYEMYSLKDVTYNDRRVDLLSAAMGIYLGALEPDFKYNVFFLKFVFNW